MRTDILKTPDIQAIQDKLTDKLINNPNFEFKSLR